jgi:hypothetical protein
LEQKDKQSRGGEREITHMRVFYTVGYEKKKGKKSKQVEGVKTALPT